MRIERRRLGLVDYDEAWALQRELALQATPELGFLLLLEHPPVITLGRNGDPGNILDPHGIPVRRVDRGGDVTYHGPGQLVGYVIRDLGRLGVRRHVRSLEASLLELLAGLGLRARRKESCVGVWAQGGKIASIGVRVSRGVSMHGFALNVSNDLAPFGYIHPCGTPGCATTSVSAELGRPVPVDEAADRFQLLTVGHMLSS
ncbi:MAG TPA: lipoyl(octanoyl) transferase LipB [Planctomycetota bacterium]|nr:lipoyl(octanoyl) transferase LipB [Planctomycetota bacterium]